MSVTYTWRITGLKTSVVANTENVIVQTYWQKIGTDGEFEGVFSGATPFKAADIPEGYTFKPFAELTEDEVISWIKATVIGNYEEHVNTQIQKQIDNKRNLVVDVDLPWASTANTSNT